MHFYQHNIPDFNNATRHLTRVERSIYRDLMELYYDTEQELPLDVALICRRVVARCEEEKAAVIALLDEYFDITEIGYRHTRCEEEIMLAREKMDEAVDRRLNERERQQRARERRRELFKQLRKFDDVPAWNTSTEQLVLMLEMHQSRPVTRDESVTSRGQLQDITQTDTASHGTDTATQYPIPNTKVKTSSAAASPLPEWIPPVAWKGFLAMRKKQKKPLTDEAIPLAIAKLKKLKDAGNDPGQVLDQSTLNCWQGLFEVKPEPGAVAAAPPKKDWI